MEDRSVERSKVLGSALGHSQNAFLPLILLLSSNEEAVLAPTFEKGSDISC